MKYFLALLVLFFVTFSASARSIEVCPILPAQAGLEWTYQEGPDFDVCYAAKPGSKTIVFGIYLGNFPSFKTKDAIRLGKGRVASKEVIWYQDNSSTFGRQTIIVLNKKYENFAHVWVVAGTEQELRYRLSILEQIKFKQ